MSHQNYHRGQKISVIWWTIRNKNPVHFICQENKIYQCDGLLMVPDGVRADVVAPFLSWIDVETKLKTLIAVLKRIHGCGKVIDEWH
jgi:hypothetical protein